MEILKVSEARKSLFGLVDDVAESHRPIHIAGKRNSAVLISHDDWTAIQETLYLAAIPGMRKSIKKGMETPVDKCATDLKW